MIFMVFFLAANRPEPILTGLVMITVLELVFLLTIVIMSVVVPIILSRVAKRSWTMITSLVV